MTTKPSIQSHSYRHFDNLQLSAKEFYEEVTNQIKGYQFPGVVTDVRLKREGGMFTAEREYLCVFRGDMEFDICAAPFGKSFFISWYLLDYRDPILIFLSRLWVIGWLFRPSPKTYYQLDAELIFSKSIDAIVRAAVAKVASEHGFTLPDGQLATA